MINPSDKHVLVAGGSWGIGAAAAKMAARAGVCVSVNYQKNADAAAAVVGEIEAAGGRGWAVQADVAEDGALDRAVDEAVGRLGPLRGMVVSAGVFEGGA